MLSPDAIIQRRKGIGGSDAAKIVSGDWFALWQDKTGRTEPEDLSGVWPVQLGVETEALNLAWYGLRSGHKMTRMGEVVIHPEHKFMRCTLDGWDADDLFVIQAKHVNGFSKIDEVRARYTPQVRHECIVTGAKAGILSVIIGANEPVLELIERDDFWETDYIEKCREFWGYVERDEEPPQGKPLEAAPVPKAMRVVDMSGSNAWASGAADWLANKDAAKTFKKAETDIKSMIDPDVREASGFGIKVSRSKAGSLSIKENK